MRARRRTTFARPAAVLAGLGGLVGAAAVAALLAAGSLSAQQSGHGTTARERPPNILLISVDTLRSDRLSGYGYRRPTSPNLDRLFAAGARFTEARTVEPLTTPAAASMLTSLYPHEHGSTRNGLRVRPNLPSMPKTLARRGYLTAAFVANWTLKDQLSGLAEHFDDYHEVFTKKRWFGLFKSEADAEDLNEEALAWLADHGDKWRPFFLWVHYVEPHAPYVLHERFAERLGVDPGAGKADRYDTEVAAVDAAVGEILDWLADHPKVAAQTLVSFVADHGESLGEHGVWGHGRNLYDEALHIPLAVSWPGRIAPQTVDAPATLIDLPATLLGLVGLPAPARFHGFDWTGVLAGTARPDPDRVTFYQAHKAAALSARHARQLRRHGLLEVAILRGRNKETLRIDGDEHLKFDLRRDPDEAHDLDGDGSNPSPELLAWMQRVESSLETSLSTQAQIDAESEAKLRALGYLD